MQIVHLLFIVASIGYLEADEIRASYEGNVILPGYNSEVDPFRVAWSIQSESGVENVFTQFSDGNQTIGDAYLGRVELDFQTANLTISALNCADQQVYGYEVAASESSPVVPKTHTLLLGVPAAEDLRVDVMMDGEKRVFVPGACEPLPINTSPGAEHVSISITASVRSKPGVSFSVDAEVVPAMCRAGDRCPEEEVLCAMTTTRTIPLSGGAPDIHVRIEYEDVEPWDICIRPDLTVGDDTTAATPPNNAAAARVSGGGAWWVWVLVLAAIWRSQPVV